MDNFVRKLKAFFKSRTRGFYVSLAAAVLLLITALIYSITFSLSEHINLSFEASVLVLMILGVAVFGVLSAFKVTERYAPAALFAFGFLAFLYFNLTSYIYLSAVFFEVAGAGAFFKALGTMEFGYAFTLVALIAVWICSTIGIFTKMSKQQNNGKEVKEDEVTA